VPVLNLLETRLYEARRQRVTAAIKLLAAADPERCSAASARAMASWEWNLQDLAVSELSRPNNSASAVSTAFVFSAILADAHPMVVPMMIDQLGLAQETTAVPQLRKSLPVNMKLARPVCAHQGHRSARPHACLRSGRASFAPWRRAVKGSPMRNLQAYAPQRKMRWR